MGIGGEIVAIGDHFARYMAKTGFSGPRSTASREMGGLSFTSLRLRRLQKEVEYVHNGHRAMITTFS